MLRAHAPHLRVFQSARQRVVYLIAEVFHRAPAAVVREHDGLVEVGFLSRLFRVDADQAHVVPRPSKEVVHPEFHVARDADAVRAAAQGIDLLDRQRVDFVVHVQTPDVLAVALQDVNELIHGDVFAEQQLAVMDLVLREYLQYRALGHLRESARNDVVHLHAAAVLRFDVDARRRLVQPQSHRLELSREDLLVRVRAVRRLALRRV